MGLSSKSVTSTGWCDDLGSSECVMNRWDERRICVVGRMSYLLVGCTERRSLEFVSHRREDEGYSGVACWLAQPQPLEHDSFD